MTTSPPTTRRAAPAAETDPGLGWSSVAVHCGGAELIDAAVAQVLGPTITEAEPSAWFFERHAEGEGMHLRVHSRARDETDDRGLAPRLAELLSEMRDEPAPEPLLPRPNSQLGGAAERRVEPTGLPLERAELSELERSAALFQASSKVALDAARARPSALTRVALALRVCGLLGELGLAQGARAALWELVADGWSGDDERERLTPDLLAAARELGRDGPGGFDQFERAATHFFEEAGDDEAPDLVRLHAHLSCNRLGVTPLEERLVATLLADGAYERITAEADQPAEDEPEDEENEPGDAVLRLRGVAKEHDAEAALRGVSFDVREGELFGLFGPRGAGKTSLLAVAAGLRLPSSGSVETLGLDPLEERARLVDQVVLVADDEEVAEQATVRENLELRARSHWGVESAPDAILSEASLAMDAATPVDELSPGRRRLLAIACALVSSPRLLLIDEPGAGLSPVEREPVWELLRAQRDGGRTVVVATSSLQEAQALCERVAVVMDGTVLAVEPPGEIAERFGARPLVFDTETEPDRAALEDLPEVESVHIDQHAGHWTVELETHQPEELLKLIESDPALPAVVNRRADEDGGGFPEPGTW